MALKRIPLVLGMSDQSILLSKNILRFILKKALLRYLSAMLQSLQLRIFTILLMLSPLTAWPQTNLLPNGSFEQIEIDTNWVTMANSEAGTYRINDISVAWGMCKREMIIVRCRDWNFEQYGWFTNMTYYTDSAYSRTGKVFGVITPFNIGPTQALNISNLCGRLCTPLIAGHSYKVSFYIKAFEGNCYSNQISVAFTNDFNPTQFALNKNEVGKHGTDLNIEKVFTIPAILESKTYTQYSFQYTAKGGEQYIYLGNFHIGYAQKGEYQRTDRFGPGLPLNRNPFIDYAVDDIVVEPVDTTEFCIKAITAEPQISASPILPDTLQLPSIYFDYNDSITPYSFTALADTLSKLNNYHTILLNGFTDNTGTLTYNQQLSQLRAAFVAGKIKGLTTKIIVARGMGLSSTVVEANLQRRVDIYVIK